MTHLLVTGGTGSFGHKVATSLASLFDRVTIFSRDEKKQHDMRLLHPKFDYIVGDVRNYSSLYDALTIGGVTHVFHAAALKQVPSCERYPQEAIQTNCLGTQNVCTAARYSGRVEKVIYLSTDKAVQPINAMGISKAMGEKIVTSQPEGGPIYCCVRYGNVLSSRGSVLPVWAAQMKRDMPLTITNPKMTRFIMNLKDAVGLVEFALNSGQNGDILVWRAPALTIQQLANRFLHFCKENSYPINHIGIRPGEKMHEVLVCEDEWRRIELVDKDFFRIQKNEPQLDPNFYFEPKQYASNSAPEPILIMDMLREAMNDLSIQL